MPHFELCVAQTDIQNGVSKKEEFILSAVMHAKAMNTETFIATHIKEQVQSSKVVITAGGIITIITRALGFDSQVNSSVILCTPGHINLVTCSNIKLFWAFRSGQLWLNHHG